MGKGLIYFDFTSRLLICELSCHVLKWSISSMNGANNSNCMLNTILIADFPTPTSIKRKWKSDANSPRPPPLHN